MVTGTAQDLHCPGLLGYPCLLQLAYCLRTSSHPAWRSSHAAAGSADRTCSQTRRLTGHRNCDGLAYADGVLMWDAWRGSGLRYMAKQRGANFHIRKTLRCSPVPCNSGTSALAVPVRPHDGFTMPVGWALRCSECWQPDKSDFDAREKCDHQPGYHDPDKGICIDHMTSNIFGKIDISK